MWQSNNNQAKYLVNSWISTSRQQHSCRAQELCKSRGGHPGLPVPNSPYGLCGRKAALKLQSLEAINYDSRGGRPGLPVPNNPYGLCGR